MTGRPVTVYGELALVEDAPEDLDCVFVSPAGAYEVWAAGEIEPPVHHRAHLGVAYR